MMEALPIDLAMASELDVMCVCDESRKQSFALARVGRTPS